MEYPNKNELGAFVEEVDKYLNDDVNQVQVDYPDSSISPWDSGELLKLNEKLLSCVAGKGNVYAIFTAQAGSETYSLRYLGKSTRKLARQRIRNHLFKKHEKTGAKLNKVIEHIQRDGKIKLSWVGIDPESLRNYVEEELIRKHEESNWNRENENRGPGPYP